MENKKDFSAVLVLSDGTIFKGSSCGIKGTTSGEICFNTSMTGYQELFTDPSYYKQLLVSTNVHVGNYGIMEAENESKEVQISGLICRNYNDDYSRKMADESIQSYFERQNLVGICDIDTRELVRKIRTEGAMNGIISSDNFDIDALVELAKDVPSMEGMELASKVSTKKPYLFGDESAKYRVAVLDFGVKTNILRNFTSRDCLLKVFPAQTPFEELEKWNPDGYFLSNGPGDPSSMTYATDIAKNIFETGKPAFGICLGHQIIALASGLSTSKMHHGHRGGNHPVIHLETRKCEITTQNHGFSVNKFEENDFSNIKITHKNLNDDTIEGIEIVGKPIFSVQYHPEASPGPHDSRYLFDNFIALLQKHK